MGYGVYKDRAPDGFLDAAAWEEEHAFLGKDTEERPQTQEHLQPHGKAEAPQRT